MLFISQLLMPNVCSKVTHNLQNSIFIKWSQCRERDSNNAEGKTQIKIHVSSLPYPFNSIS